jgi:hypothetical protein
MNWTADQDHQNMMDQLGIETLRRGPSGNESAPNQANYDPSKANPFPNLPDALALKNGTKVTTAEMWWKHRRPEIIQDFEREVIGRVPENVPKVNWTVAGSESATIGSYPVISKKLVGHVDNSSYPLISVDIQMTVVTPAKARGPVPLMMMFSRGGFPTPSSSFTGTAGDPPATGPEASKSDSISFPRLQVISPYSPCAIPEQPT